MPQWRLRWQLYGSYLLVMLPAVMVAASIAWTAGRGSISLGATLTLATALVLAILATAYVIAIRVSRPLEHLAGVSERFGRGDLGYKPVPPIVKAEIGLAPAVQLLAWQLEDRLRTIVRQSNEREAVLASMVEGVLAIDSDQRVITLNAAAAELVASAVDDPLGRLLDDVVENSELRRFARAVLVSDQPLEEDLTIHGDTDRVLQIRGTALRDVRGRGIGAVIVLSDVTHFRRLETIRRDFVANVSHELKTPITSIKGFVETLLDGALANPEDAERFLRIVATQADRLNAIIEDLLSLSKIEQSEEAADMVVEEASLRTVLAAAVDDCRAKADEGQIRLRVDCDESIVVRINPLLLEQAITNLIDNAIKYSEPNDEVRIWVRRSRSRVSISVEDEGCGIEGAHLPRLFERFYRVDKARSRKLGGTGLGLAIVKHIVQAHKGRITVESTPGVGSTFQIHLPTAAPGPTSTTVHDSASGAVSTT